MSHFFFRTYIVLIAIFLSGCSAEKEIEQPEVSPEVSVLIAQLENGSNDEKLESNHALRKLGNKASPAVPVLVVEMREYPHAQNYDERYVCDQCAITLGIIGGKGLSALISDIGNDDPKIRRTALFGIPNDESGLAAIQRITECLDDRNVDVRRIAAKTLGRFGPLAKDAIDSIVEHHKTERDSDTKMYLSYAFEQITKAQ